MTKLFNRPETKKTRRKLRREATVYEDRLWMFLKKKQIANQKFRRQVNIGQYFVDFYCPKQRLIIEVDGKIHQDPKIKENDINRQGFLESLGLVVLRFNNFDINYHIEEVLETIKKFLLSRLKSPSPYEGEG